MKKVIAAIVWLILFCTLIGGIVMIYRYTNGFNEDFKTFYIERDGKRILSAESTAAFEADKEVRFDVGYIFDALESETRDYNVQILPNPEIDFDFEVDGVFYSWRGVKGLEKCFSLEKKEDHFTIKMPKYNSIADYLREIYAGSEIDISGAFTEGAEGEISFFLLRVSSYNDAVKYDIAFCVLSSVTGYSITFSCVPGGNTWMTKIVCPTRAEAGEVVSFSWEWSGESPYQDLQSVTVKTESGTSVEWSWAADYSSRQFTMPAENVTILVTYGHSVHGDEDPVTGYSITFSSVPGGNGWMTKIVCPTRAEAGEVVSFSWEWSGESPYQDLQDVTVKTESGTSVEWSWAADYSSRQFTMPAENVTILVTYGHSVHGG